jgi:predicted RNase H-like HicB family nuclease
MNVKIIVHNAEEGGFWAEAPALPGWVSQGETTEELTANMREAVAAAQDGDQRFNLRPNAPTAETLATSERGKDLHSASGAEDLFHKLGV